MKYKKGDVVGLGYETLGVIKEVVIEDAGNIGDYNMYKVRFDLEFDYTHFFGTDLILRTSDSRYMNEHEIEHFVKKAEIMKASGEYRVINPRCEDAEIQSS